MNDDLTTTKLTAKVDIHVDLRRSLTNIWTPRLSLFLLSLFKLIRPMQPIQKANGPIVQVELLVMQIVHFRLVFEEIVPTMYSRSVDELVGQEGPEG